MVVVDQSAALLSAPLALAEEFNGRCLVILPYPANAVDLMASIEQPDQAGGVVVDPDLIIPWTDPEIRCHLHDFDASGVGVVTQPHLLRFGQCCRTDQHDRHKRYRSG